MARKEKKSFVWKCGMFGMIVGIISIATSILLLYIIGNKINDALDKVVRINSPSEDIEAFQDWIDPSRKNNPRKHWRGHFFNITSLPGKDELPHLKEVESYKYIEYDFKYNVTNHTFPLGIVSWNERSFFEKANVSDASDDTDKIVGIWTSLLVTYMQLGPGGPKDGLTNVKLDFLIAGAFYQMGLNILENVLCFAHIKNCKELAAKHWGMGTAIPQFKLNSNESFVKSELFMKFVEAVKPTLFKILSESASKEQYPEFAVKMKTTLTENEALGLLFGEGPDGDKYLCPFSVTTGESNIIPLPEVNIPCATYFLQLCVFNSPNCGKIFPIYSSDQTKFNQLKDQIASSGEPVKKIIFKLGNVIDSDNNPLFVWRHPREWLFSYNDPLLALFGKNENSAMFPSNFTSIKEAWEADNGTTMAETGLKDVTKASYYRKYEGQYILPAKQNPMDKEGFWCGFSQPVYGHDDNQFPTGKMTLTYPFHENGVSKDGLYSVWVPELYRPLNVSYHSEKWVKGIYTMKFIVDDSSFIPYPDRYQTKYFGLINLTCPQGGVPIIASLPHFDRAIIPGPSDDGFILPKIDYNPNVLDLETHLDVHPISGTTLSGAERLQMSLYIEPSWLGLSEEKGGKVLFPILWLEKEQQMTDDQAHKIKTQLNHNVKLRRVIFLVLVITGSVLVFLATAFFIFSSFCISSKRYDNDYQNLETVGH